jgi:hypothetical protein
MDDELCFDGKYVYELEKLVRFYDRWQENRLEFVIVFEKRKVAIIPSNQSPGIKY